MDGRPQLAQTLFARQFTPHFANEVPLGEEPPGVGGKGLKQLVLGLGQFDHLTGSLYDVMTEVQRQVTYGEDWNFSKLFPEKSGSDSLQQLGGFAGFCQVLVRASFKGGNLVGL
jgi:hypothetical protein